MQKTAKVAPPNSLVLISDGKTTEIPRDMGGDLIASTGSCIAVGCRSEADGDTEFVLGRATEVAPGGAPAIRRQLDTLTGRLVVQTILGDTILEIVTPHQQTIVSVWVNDSAEPDKVIVGIE